MRWERLLSADLSYGFLVKGLGKTTGTSAATYIKVPAAISGEYLQHLMRIIQFSAQVLYIYIHPSRESLSVPLLFSSSIPFIS
jgi:hypothetical protein